jgi:MFS transporter, DHA1 family, tetracycline resistance protein
VPRRNRRREGRQPLPPGFGILWTTVAIDLVGFGIVVPILPQYADRFGVSPTVIGFLFASFSLAQLAIAPLWGRVSDRIGRKPVILISLFGTALGSLLTGIAPNIWLLFAGRILDGASGASVSVAQASVADMAPPDQRPRLMGLLGAAFGFGFVVGPALGALAGLGGAHVPFYVAAALAFVNALIAIKRLPETSPKRVDEAVDRGAMAEADGEGIADLPALDGPGIAEPAHMANPDAREGSSSSSPEPVAASARRAIIHLILVAFVGMIAFSGFEATFSLLVERRFGLHISSTAFVFTAIGIALVAVQVGVVGPTAESIGTGSTLRMALVCNAIGLGLLAVDAGWVLLIAALGLLVLGQGLLTPTLSAAVSGLAGRRRGEWLGWQQSAGGFARVVGPITAGAVFEHVGMGAPYVVGAVLALVALSLVPKAADDVDAPARRH